MGGFIIMLIEGVSNIFTAIATRRQHQMMQEMYQAEMERQKAMMARGGDNPWEVNYDEKLAKNQDGIDQENSLKDSSEGGSGILSKAKSFSF